MKISKYLIYIIWFLLGGLISYIFSQISYLKIDTEINVIETFIAAISIVIGLYIAVAIQQRYNRNQNLYNYLIARLDAIWSDFNILSNQIEANDQIELSRVTKFINDLQRKNSDFDKLLTGLDSIPNDFEKLSENLRVLFESSLVKDNIVYYDSKKEGIIKINKSITENLANIFKQINSKV